MRYNIYVIETNITFSPLQQQNTVVTVSSDDKQAIMKPNKELGSKFKFTVIQAGGLALFELLKGKNKGSCPDQK